MESTTMCCKENQLIPFSWCVGKYFHHFLRCPSLTQNELGRKYYYPLVLIFLTFFEHTNNFGTFYVRKM